MGRFEASCGSGNDVSDYIPTSKRLAEPWVRFDPEKATGVWEEAKANNIYDLAGNNWEWTQEKYGSESYVMRGGYNLMGGACPGSVYPAALRDPLPGNDRHPNVVFRVALFIK